MNEKDYHFADWYSSVMDRKAFINMIGQCVAREVEGHPTEFHNMVLHRYLDRNHVAYGYVTYNDDDDPPVWLAGVEYYNRHNWSYHENEAILVQWAWFDEHLGGMTNYHFTPIC